MGKHQRLESGPPDPSSASHEPLMGLSLETGCFPTFNDRSRQSVTIRSTVNHRLVRTCPRPTMTLLRPDDEAAEPGSCHLPGQEATSLAIARKARVVILAGDGHPRRGAAVKITNEILEGYLNCKTKGHLKLAGEGGTKSEYEAMTTAAKAASREAASPGSSPAPARGMLAGGSPSPRRRSSREHRCWRTRCSRTTSCRSASTR